MYLIEIPMILTCALTCYSDACVYLAKLFSSVFIFLSYQSNEDFDVFDVNYMYVNWKRFRF